MLYIVITAALRLSDMSLARALVSLSVAVLWFSFWGPLGWRHFHLGGHTTNTFVLNYRVCNRLYQIINTGKFIS